MNNKEKDDNPQLYGHLSQQNESPDPTSEQQSFEVHKVYPYEHGYNFSQQYQEYPENQYDQHNMLSQSFSNYEIAYNSIPQSNSIIANLPNHPSISTDSTDSTVINMPFPTDEQNHDRFNIFYANNSKSTQYEPFFTFEMLKNELVKNNTTSSTSATINVQTELNTQNFFENGYYSLDPNFSYFNDKYTSNPSTVVNNHINQQLFSGLDTHSQNSNTRQEKDVFNELLSLASNKKQSTSYFPIIQQHNQITTDNVKNTQTKSQKKSSSSTNYKSKYKDYSEANSYCAFDHLDLIYNLVMVQQPSRARMCGFGDKDRRPISPPPIAKLVITSSTGEPVSSEYDLTTNFNELFSLTECFNSTFDISFLVAMCDIWKCENDTIIDANIVKHHGSLSQLITFSDDNESTTVNMKNLVGSTAVSATKLYDLEGNLGIFFVFHDISLRTEGRFRLRITLIDIGSPYKHTVNTTSISKAITSIYTEPFVVYTAKKFPGVTDSTPLSKCFARQGIKISIRKDSSKNDPSSKKCEKKNLE